MPSAPWQTFAGSVIERAQLQDGSPVLPNLLGKGLPAQAWQRWHLEALVVPTLACGTS